MTRSLHLSTELLLWITAALCLGGTAFAAAIAVEANYKSQLVFSRSAEAHQRLSPSELIKIRNEGGTSSSTNVGKPNDAGSNHVGEVIGLLRIPALSLSVPITAGVDTTSLLKGVGHVEGTAFPGGLGTVALAGHRDTYLRPLERIVPGMDIQVSDASGTYHYAVDRFEIVTPDQVDVLEIRVVPELVLITCYPFHYIGAAPKRFVVHATLKSLSPDRPTTVNGQ